MFGRSEKKVIKAEIQNVTLPVMDAYSEGDVLAVVMEQGKEFQNTTDFVLDWLPKSADMGATVNQTLSMTCGFILKSGKYSELTCEFSVRKRKKGALGKQIGSAAFKKLAWANVELHKYVTKSGKQKIMLPLYWNDEGEEHLGRGAQIELILTIQSLMTDESGNEVTNSKVTSKLSTAEAVKSDLAEGRELLAQRGEKLSQMAEASDELAQDSSEYAKLAKQLSGGGGNVKKAEKKDHAAAIAARHAKPAASMASTASTVMTTESSGSQSSQAGSKSNGRKPATMISGAADKAMAIGAKPGSEILKKSVPIARDDRFEGLSDDEDGVGDAGSATGSADDGADILEMDLDKVLLNDTDVAQSAKSRGPNIVGARSTQDTDTSKPLPVQVLGNIGYNIVNRGKMLGHAVAKGGHVVLNTGQSIVATGVNTINKTGIIQNATNVSQVVLGGVRSAVDVVTGNNSSHGEELTVADIQAIAQQEEQNKEKLFTEYANIEFPKAEIDANTTTDDLKILEQLEAARLENITLREKAIQFEFQIAKFNFFVGEMERLQAEKDTTEAAMKTVEANLQSITQRLTAKNEENASLMQEIEVMKTKIALTMADTARAKEEQREVEANIEAVKKSLGKYDPKYRNPEPSSEGNNPAVRRPTIAGAQRPPPPPQEDDGCIVS